MQVIQRALQAAVGQNTQRFLLLKSQFSSLSTNEKSERTIPYASKLELQDLISQRSTLPLVDIFKDLILTKGPLSFATFMESALLHEKYGYYMKKDVFNKKGDFITSVEISQMFGEILGIWVINFLEHSKIIGLNADSQSISQQEEQRQKKFALLEFGPGRGTLMCDVLRTLAQFNLLQDFQINMIEFSDFMTKMQQENIMATMKKYSIYFRYEKVNDSCEQLVAEDAQTNISIRWFKLYEGYIAEEFGDLQLVKNKKPYRKPLPVVILAHEFFDAMPVHIFQYTKRYGWCEKLVNICHDATKGKNFEFMLSDGPNKSVKTILQPDKTYKDGVDLKDGDCIEISPRALLLANSISELISKVNGAALIIDYGEFHAFSDSVRAIRKHKYIEKDLLIEFPGEVDYSAYVNFEQLANACIKVPNIKTDGPMPQGLFLESMGINARLDMLCRSASPSVAERLQGEYMRLVSPEQMGSIFKCFYIGRKSNADVYPFITDPEKQEYY